jgi:hypothetical protein
MSYLFLIDVVHAAHCGRIPCISAKELFMLMPSSPYNFHQMYSCLTTGFSTLPSDLKADEDILLLLTGICADILYNQHADSNIFPSEQETPSQVGLTKNPYAPLSPNSEALRHWHILDVALTRWHQHCGQIASNQVLSMFYLCRLLLALPDILKVPRFVGYPTDRHQTSPLEVGSCDSTRMDVSNEAIRYAWLILENSCAHTKDASANVSIWLPVALFYAALTVWSRVRNEETSAHIKTGTMRTLKIFKDELKGLPWPCCAQMCHTLDKLVSGYSNHCICQPITYPACCRRLHLNISKFNFGVISVGRFYSSALS